MIQADNLSKSYQGTGAVIANISLAVGQGRILAIVGKSGGGKSTILNLLAGTALPDSGAARLTQPVGYLSEDTWLLPWRTALENVLLPLEFSGRVTEAAVQQARELLTLLELGSAADRFPAELSGGMRQRVAIARTLLHDGATVLLDEPLSALDFDMRLRTGQLIRDWIKKTGKALVLVTHHIDEAIAISDEIAVLAGTPGAIALRAAVPFSESEREPRQLRQNHAAQQMFVDVLAALTAGAT